jgi:hypothetical protein
MLRWQRNLAEHSEIMRKMLSYNAQVAMQHSKILFYNALPEC